MAITEQTDQVTQAVALLLQQYRGKPVMEAYLSSLVTPIQELEGVIFDVLDLRQVDAATGEQLDLLGRVVGERRAGRSDDDYRRWIKARIVINRGDGTPNEMLEITALVSGADIEDLVLTESTAEGHIEITTLAAGVAGATGDAIQTAKPAGVRWQTLWYVDEDTFQFSTTGGTVTDAAKGFEGSGSTGGVLSHAR